MSLMPLGLLSQGGGAGNGGNALTLISTTVLNSSATGVAFNSIVGTYKHLQLRITARTDAGGQSALNKITMNSLSGIYNNHILKGDGSAVISSSESATAGIYSLANASGNTASTYAPSIIDILDYTSTNKNKTFRIFTGSANPGESNVSVILRSGLMSSTAAITQLNVDTLSGSYVAGSRFSLYGVS